MMSKTIFQDWSIKTKVTAFTLAIFVISIWSLAFYVSRILREDMERLSGEQQFSTVTYMAAKVNQELDDRLRALGAAAGEVTLAEMNDTAILQAYLEQRQLLQFLFNGGVDIVNPGGVVIADVPLSSGRMGRNYMADEWISAALKEGKSTISRPLMGPALRAPVFVMTVPIRDARGKVVGALNGVVNLGKPSFLDRITENHYGKTGGYVLAAPQHRLIITATDKSRVMERIPAPGVVPAIDRFLQGYDGSAVYVNPVGVEVLASGMKIPVASWIVASILPTAEAFAPVRSMQWRVLLASILLTVLAGVLTWWMLRRQLAPMLEVMRALATRSSTDKARQPLPIERQDEIGELVGGFNRLLETLTQRDEALRESETHYRELFSKANEGLLVMSDTGQFLDFNQAFAEMHGYTVDELKRLDVAQLDVLKERALKERADLMRSIQAGQAVRFEVEHYHKNGHIFPLSVTASNLRIGSRMCFLAFHQDISERKRAEAALQESRSQYRDLVERTSDLVTRVDAEGRLVFVNSSSLKIWGLAPGDCIGRLAFDFIAAEDRDGTVAAFQSWLESGTGPLEYENRQVGIDGRVHAMSWMIGVERDESGSVIGFASTARDITRRRQQESLIKEHNELLTRQKGELEANLGRIRRLEGMLSICMSCKKIRTQNEDWHQLERYIGEHSDAIFSHGLCPECLAKEVRKLE